ncbi:hypothetical protein [Sphingomonas sp. MM-1]|uniref:hypothetical protein n=1 Tax=Sphingomonas sp. MM-1 TaxID=745310 RepID=UPI000AD6857E|nr:hypothetical protein [Sphingomonas sp. MM-1]
MWLEGVGQGWINDRVRNVLMVSPSATNGNSLVVGGNLLSGSVPTTEMMTALAL